MPFTLTTTDLTEAEATEEITARGWYPLTFAAPAEVSEWHWHDFDSVLYILDGSLTIEFDDGTPAFACTPGVRIDAPRERVHREITDGYTAVFGFSVDPAMLTNPINKPVAQLV